MPYTVSVSMPFNRACPWCRAEAEHCAVASISDTSVTSIKLSLMPSCKHKAAEPEGLPDGVLPGQLPLTGISMIASDTNGFDPSGRQ